MSNKICIAILSPLILANILFLIYGWRQVRSDPSWISTIIMNVLAIVLCSVSLIFQIVVPG